MDYPIVLLFVGLSPQQLGAFRNYARRAGSDLAHVDLTKSGLNETVIGAPDWVEQLRTDIAEASRTNLANEIAARLARRRPKEAREVSERGLSDPWKFTRHGPLREGVLTVHHAWFGGGGYANWDPEKVAAFRERSLRFLAEEFGDACVHARIDMDEEAMHLHFVIAPWHEKVSANRGVQRLLQPSSQPLLADYEKAQDVVATYFADLGIMRGRRWAEEIRLAKERELAAPSRPVHVSPSDWRRSQFLEREQALREIERQRSEIEVEEAAADRREDYHAALQRGLHALARKEVVYVPAKGDRPARLQRGPAFPEDKAARRDLEAAVRACLPGLMQQARALAQAARFALAAEQAALRQDRQALEEARDQMSQKEQQLGQLRDETAARAQRMAGDLRRIAALRAATGLACPPELEQLVQRYRPEEED